MKRINKSSTILPKESFEFKRIKNGLTKVEDYISILEVIVLSESPVSASEVVEKLIAYHNYPEEKKSEAYRKLKTLVPIDNNEISKRTYICEWGRLSNSEKELQVCLKKISEFFDLDWKIDMTKSFTHLEKDRNTYTINNKESKNFVKISLDDSFCDGTISKCVGSDSNISEALAVRGRINNGRKYVYLKKPIRDPSHYCDLVLDEKVKRKHQWFNDNWDGIKDRNSEDIYNVMPKGQLAEIVDNDFNDVVRDSDNWRYRINLRGLLLYLYLISQHTKKPNIRTMKKILSNPQVQRIAPFLLFWEDFYKDGFNAIFVLFKIAIEFQFRLKYRNSDEKKQHDRELLYEVTKRYLIYLQDYYNSLRLSLRLSLPGQISVSGIYDIYIKSLIVTSKYLPLIINELKTEEKAFQKRQEYCYNEFKKLEKINVACLNQSVAPLSKSNL